jgi:hypothetical protein
MKWFTRQSAKAAAAAAAAAAVTAAVMAGAPAFGQSSARTATTAIPIIKSGFRDGPVFITTGTHPATVTSMSLGKGSWAIFAKAYVAGGSNAVFLNCQLVAGTDFDQTRPQLEAGVDSAFSQSIALNVVHKFAVAGKVKFRCTTFGIPVAVYFIKITAIKAGSLTNVALP